MPELSKYGFRDDKAKEPFADETTFEAVKKLALDIVMVQTPKIAVPANGMVAYTFDVSAKTLPMPALNLMTARRQDNTSLIVREGVMAYVFASEIRDFQTEKARLVTTYICNANDYPIYVWMNAQFMIRTYGDDFPTGQAWNLNILNGQ